MLGAQRPHEIDRVPYRKGSLLAGNVDEVHVRGPEPLRAVVPAALVLRSQRRAVTPQGKAVKATERE